MQLSLLESLPEEVLRHVLRHCNLDSLLSLSSTNRSLHEIISTDYLANFSRSCLNYDPRTLKHIGFHARAPWSQRTLWADRTSERWANWDGRGQDIGGPRREWRRCLPTLKLWDVEDGVGVVLVGKGRDLEAWFTRSDGSVEVVPVVIRSPPARRRITPFLPNKGAPDPSGTHEDITALATGTRAGEIIVSRVSGVIQRLRVVEYADSPGQPLVLEETARYAIPNGSAGGRRLRTTVQTIHSCRDVFVSSATIRQPASYSVTIPEQQQTIVDPRGPIVSLARTLKERSAAQSHSVSLHSIVAPWQPAVSIPFATKPWSVHLSPQRTWLAVGHSGTAPLSLFQLDSTGAPISTPTQVAHTPKSTSVYAMATFSEQCSPFSDPEQMLVAAFYDSTTRVYDLRIPPSRVASSWDAVSAGHERPANEVLRLADPWSDDPCYSVAVGGAQGAYVAVGSARNGAVRLFDIRSPSHPQGITAFAPGRDRSPVYSLEMEGSRLWGCTESRGFVLDFEAFEAPRRRMEKVAFVGHREGQGGVLQWMGDGA
ncbi:hypothetical protein JCM10908_002148 [Rhodotorula pacifica]|uniref:uncharacterized protein n=1 Tax=Rhodotorula pacifica TaxID=1495444 RepID=UPI00317A7171